MKRGRTPRPGEPPQSALMDLGQDDVHIPQGIGAVGYKTMKKTAKPGTKPTKKKTPRVSVTVSHPKHGRMTVRAMREAFFGETCGLEASMADAAGGDLVWIQLAKQGKFLGHAAGPFEMSEQTFREIIANFKAHPELVPIDLEHASEADASSGNIPTVGAPAQGWIHDMKVQNGQLWGQVEWLAQAREYIRNKQYRYFSPAIRFGARDRVSGKPIGARMSSGAMTNIPFLSSLQPLSAKDGEHEEADVTEDHIDDENTPSEEDELEDEETATMKDETMTVALKEAQERATSLSEKVATMTVSMKEQATKLTTAEGELKTLREEKAKRDEIDEKRAVDAAFDTYKDSRNLSDVDREVMAFTRKSNPDMFARQYPVVPAGKRHLLRSIAGGGKRGDEATTEDTTGTIPEGKQLRPDAVVVLADKYQRENPHASRAQALNYGVVEVRKLQGGQR